MKKMVINENGIDKLVEYPNEEAKEKFLSKNSEIKKEHTCKNDILLVDNIVVNGRETIRIMLDCSCSKDCYEPVIAFEDNSLMSAKDNFKGWLCQVCPYLIQNDYRIKDNRKYEN